MKYLNSRISYSVTLYVLIMVLVFTMKPKFIFNKDGSIKRYVETDEAVQEDPKLLGQPIINPALPPRRGATIPPEEGVSDDLRVKRVASGVTDAEGSPTAALPTGKKLGGAAAGGRQGGVVSELDDEG